MIGNSRDGSVKLPARGRAGGWRHAILTAVVVWTLSVLGAWTQAVADSRGLQSILVDRMTVYAWPEGTQVEYTAADGRAYLWSPANPLVVRGTWRWDDRQVCFTYGLAMAIPVAADAAEDEFCWTESSFLEQGQVSIEGDAFELARRGTAPWPRFDDQRLPGEDRSRHLRRMADRYVACCRLAPD